MELAQPHCFRGPNHIHADEPLVLLCRRTHGNACRGPPRPRPYSGHSPAAAEHLSLSSGIRDHHAGGDLLWSHVWRVHDFHPGEHPWGSSLGRDLPGRVPDGPKRPGGTGPGNRRLRLLYCRDLVHAGSDVGRSPSGQMSPWLSALPRYFSLTLLGLLILIYMASKSILKALMMAVFGLLIGTIGMDSISGTQRLTFGIIELSDGVGLIPVIMGVFGVAEVITNVEDVIKQELVTTKVKNLLPSIQDWRGFILANHPWLILGFLHRDPPGPAPVISAFSSYALEKKLSKHPEKFGTGVIEGVAGPEAANNSATGGALIPLFTLGIPSNSVSRSFWERS